MLGCPLDEAFTSCCTELAGNSTTTEPNRCPAGFRYNNRLNTCDDVNGDRGEEGEEEEEEEGEEEEESVCPVGFQYNAGMNVCDDIDEAGYSTNDCTFICSAVSSVPKLCSTTARSPRRSASTPSAPSSATWPGWGRSSACRDTGSNGGLPERDLFISQKVFPDRLHRHQ